MEPISWEAARRVAWEAGRAVAPAPARAPLPETDHLTLAEPLVARTNLPAFPTSSVDGWAVRGEPPWRVTGRILAGAVPPPLAGDGECAEIATGAMVPAGTTAILRIEDSDRDSEDRVIGVPRDRPEWREPGEEASAGEHLLPAGTAVTPGVIGLAASCGYDDLAVRPRPRAAVLVFGDELLGSGLPGAGRVRDALGPSVPAWLRRLGASPDHVTVRPGQDTLDAHVSAISSALHHGADLVCTTGGTMHGPVDHVHPALAAVGANYLANTVAVRPGFPMLLASVDRPEGGRALIAGLPGNPQSAVIALLTLVAPALAGWLGRPAPSLERLPTVRLAGPVRGRGADTHLALVTRHDLAAERDVAAGHDVAAESAADSAPGWDDPVVPVPHAGSAMLRGLSRAVGFAVIAPGSSGATGDRVPLLPLPLAPGELPTWAG